MNDNVEAEMMERDHTWRLVRAAGFTVVAIVGIVASCCVWFPWDPPDPPDPPAKTEPEQCAAMCATSQRPVTRYVASGRFWDNDRRSTVDTPMVCECAGQVISR